MNYEDLLEIAEKEGVNVVEFEFTSDIKGLYCDGMIAITTSADGDIERKCILAEELGHYFSNIGDITGDKKQELRGRKWGYEALICLEDIVDAVVGGCEYLADLAEQLGITEQYLSEALSYFSRKYGDCVEVNGYIVRFSDQSLAVYPATA